MSITVLLFYDITLWRVQKIIRLTTGLFQLLYSRNRKPRWHCGMERFSAIFYIFDKGTSLVPDYSSKKSLGPWPEKQDFVDIKILWADSRVACYNKRRVASVRWINLIAIWGFRASWITCSEYVSTKVLQNKILFYSSLVDAYSPGQVRLLVCAMIVI